MHFNYDPLNAQCPFKLERASRLRLMCKVASPNQWPLIGNCSVCVRTYVRWFIRLLARSLCLLVLGLRFQSGQRALRFIQPFALADLITPHTHISFDAFSCMQSLYSNCFAKAFTGGYNENFILGGCCSMNSNEMAAIMSIAICIMQSAAF